MANLCFKYPGLKKVECVLSLSSGGSVAIKELVPANITEKFMEWLESTPFLQLQMFLIPLSICIVATLLTNPPILAAILLKKKLRQETRYLLLANTMLSDLVFMLLNAIIAFCNLSLWPLNRILCELAYVGISTGYISAVLTITLMVLDTYLAVRWPLHYLSLLPSSRTIKILGLIWLLAFLFPVSILILIETMDIHPLQHQKMCLILSFGHKPAGEALLTGANIFLLTGLATLSSLILYFYVKLYCITRKSGIWNRKYSRARVTLLFHSVLLLLYFGPGLIFSIELLLYRKELIGLSDRIWICITNSNVLMMLPRALSPALYGLRYREISDAVKGMLFPARVSQIGVSD
nr:PREDICTED: probable G-protein coupled receptor 148 [Latimeria chalumnae]|eukprot:XP_005991272.1 PREDICTED: probable G-protein coupled receptor 148 [Latimeria chalumnae]